MADRWEYFLRGVFNRNNIKTFFTTEPWEQWKWANNNNRSDKCILIQGREKVSVLVDLNKILKLKNSWFINHFLHHFKTAPWWTLLYDQKNAFFELLPYPCLLQAQFIVDNSPSINKGNLVKRFWYDCDYLTKIPANHQFLLHFLSSCWNV